MQPGVVEGARVQAHVHLALEPVLVHNRVSAVRGEDDVSAEWKETGGKRARHVEAASCRVRVQPRQELRARTITFDK